MKQRRPQAVGPLWPHRGLEEAQLHTVVHVQHRRHDAVAEVGLRVGELELPPADIVVLDQNLNLPAAAPCPKLVVLPAPLCIMIPSLPRSEKHLWPWKQVRVVSARTCRKMMPRRKSKVFISFTMSCVE